jgi:hypothetical protein
VKLGIAVVYVVAEGNERLFDLHLDRIAAHTRVPYTLYAGVNRLRVELRERLAGRPEVRICALPETDARNSEEHAFYLERLVDAALAEGSTHVGVLHVDSFPLRDGWARTLAAQLSPSRPFAAAVRDAEIDRKPFTACLVAEAAFLRNRRPHLLLTEQERHSAAYRRYRRLERHHPDSGVGWGLLAFRERLDWLRLERSNRGEDHCHFGSVYGDLIFHLGAAAWPRKDFPARRQPTRGLAIRAALAAAARRIAPRRARAMLSRSLARLIPALDIERKYAANQAAFAAVRARLLADPEAYLRFLRLGGDAYHHGQPAPNTRRFC